MATDTPEPQYAALRRAVRAVLDQHDRARAPFYVYIESALGARTGSESSRERAIYAASSHEDEPGDVFVAVFQPGGPEWPDPSWSKFKAAAPERVAIGRHHRHGAPPAPTGPVTSPAELDAGPVDNSLIEIDPQPSDGAPGEIDPAVLYATADQIFWQQTGYKVNQKLDPNNPNDRAMLPQWWNAYAQARELWYASLQTAPVGQRAQLDPSMQLTVGPVTVTHPTTTTSGDPTMNSRDPWLPILRSAPLSIGASAAEYGVRSRRAPLVGALAPVLAPGTGPVIASLTIDDKQVLHARVCVDGKCYQGSADLSGPIDAVLARLAAWHKAQHAADGAGAPVVGHGGGGGGHGGGGGGGYHGGYHGGGGYQGWSGRRYYPSWRRYGGGYAYYNAPYWYEPEEVVVEEVEVAPPDASDPDQVPQVDDQGDPAATAQVQGVIALAGDALVQELVGHHVQVACAGWFDDFKHAVSSAASGIEHAALGTLKKLKGPIATAAQYAATMVPGVGPIVGPMAGKLAGTLVDAAAGNGQAQAAIQQAYKAAKTNPQVQQALAVAHQVAAKTTAAYHLAQTAQNAAQGDPAAIQQVQQTLQAAQQGDPAAQQAAQVMNQTVATSCASIAQSDAGPIDPSLIEIDPQPADATAAPATVQGYPPGFVTIIGAAIAELRQRAQHAVLAARAGGAGPVLGYVITSSGATLVPLESTDDADDWYGRLDPDAILYAAYYDATDPTWPAPLNEATGNVVAGRPKGTPIPRAVATVQGWPIPLALGVAAGAGGMYAWSHRDAIRSWLTGGAVPAPAPAPKAA